uniref:Uncharacterized protein n=1 Tax=Oryza meridionalis TaxID=40149 RepID=A0A0E0DCH5_9ORYZ
MVGSRLVADPVALALGGVDPLALPSSVVVALTTMAASRVVVDPLYPWVWRGLNNEVDCIDDGGGKGGFELGRAA